MVKTGEKRTRRPVGCCEWLVPSPLAQDPELKREDSAKKPITQLAFCPSRISATPLEILGNRGQRSLRLIEHKSKRSKGGAREETNCSLVSPGKGHTVYTRSGRVRHEERCATSWWRQCSRAAIVVGLARVLCECNDFITVSKYALIYICPHVNSAAQSACPPTQSGWRRNNSCHWSLRKIPSQTLYIFTFT